MMLFKLQNLILNYFIPNHRIENNSTINQLRAACLLNCSKRKFRKILILSKCLTLD